MSSELSEGIYIIPKQLWEREANSEGIAKHSYEIATALVNRFKEESK